VVLVGTKNCTACLGACPSCSAYNPAQCTVCPDGQYFGTAGQCLLCSSSCATCSAQTTCLTCPLGSTLIGTSCYKNPTNCVGLSTATVCSACFVGYKLNTAKDACVTDDSCNGTSTCNTCTDGYYLSSKKCLPCKNLPVNCVSCLETTSCIKCSDGYYLSGTTCMSCPNSCLTCSSASFCNTAADGYYI
jgi:hypothetical protein